MDRISGDIGMKIRNSNHELLRLIAMYMIVRIHANMYLYNFYTGSLGNVFNGAVNGICNTGVTCFILISGYYGIKFDFKKLVKLECMMISYSLLETGVLCFVFPEQMRGAALLEQVVKSVLPFISRKYWFYSCYICLFLFSGYIDKLIEKLSQTEFKKLLLTSLLIFSILPTVFYFEIIPDNGKGLVQMLMVYMIGRYIRLYGSWRMTRKKALLIIAVLWVVNGISHELPIALGGIYHHLCKDNSITNLVIAVVLFGLFKEMSFQSRLINKVSGCIFAVFALNNTLVNVTMEMLVERGLQERNGIGGFLMLEGITFIIFAVCLTIGLVREGILGRLDRKIGVWVESLVIPRIEKNHSSK